MNTKKKMVFYRELATLITSGIDVLQALKILLNQKQAKWVREATDALYRGIQKGKTISWIVNINPGYFSRFERAVLGIGEKTGTLDRNLSLIADFFERQQKFISQLISGMALPFFSIHAMIFIGPLLFFLFKPGYTIASFVKDTAFLIFIIDIIPIILWQLFKIESIKEMAGRVFIHIPTLGTLIRKHNISKFLMGLRCMYEAGIDLTESLKLSSGLCENPVIRDNCRSMVKMMKKGSTLKECFSRSSLFSPMIIEMVGTGEHTGEIGRMLQKAAEYYDRDLDAARTVFIKLFPKFIYFAFVAYMVANIFGSNRILSTVSLP